MQDSLVVVTTFSNRQKEIYGNRFVASFNKYWTGAKLCVVTENQIEADPDYQLCWRRFTCPYLDGKFDGPHYRWDAKKFAWKVFAMSHASLPSSTWRYWLDADVEIHQPISGAMFSPPNVLISYLGRPRQEHSETGFIGWRTSHPVSLAMLQRMRQYYMTGEVFQLPGWTDSHVFDAVMKEFTGTGIFHNYSDGMTGLHVWPNTVLGKFMTHHKGPSRKKVAYGKEA